MHFTPTASKPSAATCSRNRMSPACPTRPPSSTCPARKFGSATDAATTWAVNCTLPAVVCKKYHGRKIVAFSTGNVYPLTSPTSGGPTETDPPNPVGEYGMAALGRERHVRILLAKTRHAGLADPAQLRLRPALRRAGRPRPRGLRGGTNRSRAWATSTRSGKATRTR